MATNPIAPAQPIAVSSSLSSGYYYFANVDPPTLELMWSDMSDDETGFELERCDNGNWSNPTNLQTFWIDTADTSKFLDTSVTQGDTYYYRVCAVNTTAPSGWLYSPWLKLHGGSGITAS